MRRLAPLTGSLMDGGEREKEKERGWRMILYRERIERNKSTRFHPTLSNGKGIIGGRGEKESSYTLIHLACRG